MCVALQQKSWKFSLQNFPIPCKQRSTVQQEDLCVGCGINIACTLDKEPKLDTWKNAKFQNCTFF
jgi:hypothetical protein